MLTDSSTGILVSNTQSKEAPMESTEKGVARRFYEIVTSGRPEDLDEICAADLKGHAGAGSDLQELKAAVASFIVPFPDLQVDIRHLVQEGELVSAWISYTATHEADFAGVPATGGRVRFAGWDLIRVHDEKIVEITQYCDLFTILSQIGALPTAAPA